VCPREKCHVFTLILEMFTELKALPSSAICIECDDFERIVDSSGRCYSLSLKTIFVMDSILSSSDRSSFSSGIICCITVATLNMLSSVDTLVPVVRTDCLALARLVASFLCVVWGGLLQLWL